jgi:hypothetical protein
MEQVEGIAKAEEVFEQKDGKDPLKIRIALFYDGTLNNRMNIEEREKDSDIYKSNRSDDANSYDNGRTNIAIMEPHVSQKKQDYAGDYDLVFKHYIAGHGALTHQKDSLRGYALAIGESGVPRRAEEGINLAVNSILNENEVMNPLRHYIAKLSIDVFGFSRGAATARYAIHVIFHGRITGVDEYTGAVQYEWEPVVERLNRFYSIDPSAVEVKFAGLYDTVLSYVGSQKLPWTTNALQQMAVARVKKALHLAAAEEHRQDFPLHRIVSAVNKGVGEEYFLPGVHSDVGGSYNQANELLLEKETDESKKVYMLTSDEGTDRPEFSWLGKPKGNTMVIHEGDPETLRKDREDLIAQGWYKPEEITLSELQWDELGCATHAMLTVSRKGVRSAYSNIPLKIMAKYARKPDVKLKIDAKLEDRANTILKHEDDLKELEAVIEGYMKAKKNDSKPEDWLGDNPPIEISKLKEIRHRHFHFSASKWSMGYKPRFEWDSARKRYKRVRYYYDA